jgi:DNA-binding NtrC family response regulator
MATILLVGTRIAWLEGISQTLSALGHKTSVAGNVHDARELAESSRPLIVVTERALAEETGASMLSVPLAPGGAFLLFRTGPVVDGSLSPALQRVVLADLALPLERNRLVALIQHVEERAEVTGRWRGDHNPDELSF